MRAMKPWQMVAGTTIAAITMIGAVQAYIYPRTEGEKLEVKVEKLDREHREDVRGIHKELKDLNTWLRGNGHQNK